MAASLSQPAQQVRIQLSTKHADLELPETTGPILVPTRLKRLGLSEVVNDLLGDSAATSKAVPLQFTVNGQYLRGSLASFLNEHGVSAETTLSVEYFRTQLPPTYQTSFMHDDWVGAVDVLSNSSRAGRSSELGLPPGQERILSGCYDGLLRVWNLSGDVVATSSPCLPADPLDQRPQLIYAAKFISPTHIVSGGFGVPTRIWTYDEPSSSTAATKTPTPKGTLTPVLDLKGHKGPLTPFDSITVHARASQILTSSADNTAILWSSSPTQPTSAPEDLTSSKSNSNSNSITSTSKRRRVAPSSQTNNQTQQPPTAHPLATLKSHTKPVTASIFHPSTPNAAYTASADRTLLTWDLSASSTIPVSARTPARDSGLSALAALPSISALAASTSDRRVLLVDPREDARRTHAGALMGAGGEVVSLAAEPEGASASAGGGGDGGSESGGYALAGASYDGVVRVWDVRNAGAGPTFKVEPREPSSSSKGKGKTGGGKLFSVVWDADVGIVSGGEAGRVQVNSGL